MIIVVSGCARCGHTHEVEFKEFSRQNVEIGGFVETHWGMCPELNEPILMRFQPVQEDGEQSPDDE